MGAPLLAILLQAPKDAVGKPPHLAVLQLLLQNARQDWGGGEEFCPVQVGASLLCSRCSLLARRVRVRVRVRGR
jgi:hypothetical protein